MKRDPVSYAYRRQLPGGRFEVHILVNCKTLASLLRQTPEDGIPGKYDDRDGLFRPLAGRAVA